MRSVSHCCSLLEKKKIFDGNVGLNSPLLPPLLVMCCAGGEGMLKADQDGGPVALQWGRLVRNGGWSLRSFSAPGGVTCHPPMCGRVGFCVLLHSCDLWPCRGVICLWLWCGDTHLALGQGLFRVTEHCLFLVRGNSRPGFCEEMV